MFICINCVAFFFVEFIGLNNGCLDINGKYFLLSKYERVYDWNIIAVIIIFLACYMFGSVCSSLLHSV